MCVQRVSAIPSPLVSASVFMNVSYNADQYNFILNSGNAMFKILFLKFHSLGSFVVLHELFGFYVKCHWDFNKDYIKFTDCLLF